LVATLAEIATHIFDTYGVRVGTSATGFLGHPVAARFGPVGAAVRRTSYGRGFPLSGTYQPIDHPGAMRIVRHTRTGNAVISRQHPLLGAPGYPEGSVLEASDLEACTSLIVVQDASPWGTLVRYERLDSPPCEPTAIKMSMNALHHRATERP